MLVDISLKCVGFSDELRGTIVRFYNDYFSGGVDGKLFKAEPESYKGTVADVAEILRISVVGSKKSPNLYEVLEILGKEEVNRRLNAISARI